MQDTPFLCKHFGFMQTELWINYSVRISWYNNNSHMISVQVIYF